jgi:hypothetical protein
MFALVALICFVLALFGLNLANINLVTLGFCFIALHLMFAIALPIGSFRRNQ